MIDVVESETRISQTNLSITSSRAWLCRVCKFHSSGVNIPQSMCKYFTTVVYTFHNPGLNVHKHNDWF